MSFLEKISSEIEILKQLDILDADYSFDSVREGLYKVFTYFLTLIEKSIGM